MFEIALCLLWQESKAHTYSTFVKTEWVLSKESKVTSIMRIYFFTFGRCERQIEGEREYVVFFLLLGNLDLYMVMHRSIFLHFDVKTEQVLWLEKHKRSDVNLDEEICSIKCISTFQVKGIHAMDTAGNEMRTVVKWRFVHRHVIVK